MMCSAAAEVRKNGKRNAGVAAGALLLAMIAHWGVAHAAGEATDCKGFASLAAGPGEHPGMVFVPGGAFVMGSDHHLPEERFTHLARVDGFWMDATEVTNAEFAGFVQATGYVTKAERKESRGAAVFTAPTQLTRGGDISQWWQFKDDANWRRPEGGGSTVEGRDNHPVVDVSYEDALAYAKWRGRDLPTEAEWEYASRGGHREDVDTRGAYENGKPLANTWQGVFPVLNSGEDGFVGAAPVGCFKPNAYGLYDMIGNVWEWTSDWYRRGHARDAVVNPQSPARAVDLEPGRAPSRVIKGGSFLCASNYCARYRSTSRQPQEVDLGTTHVGFRTVLRASGRRVIHAQSAPE